MRYFKPEEFQCPCCKSGMVDPELVDMLDAARVHAGRPFFITSGFRCTEHNRHVGGSPTSSHMAGYAVDVSAGDSAARFTILTALIKAGFGRIGIGDDFIHVDIDASKPDGVIWTY